MTDVQQENQEKTVILASGMIPAPGPDEEIRKLASRIETFRWIGLVFYSICFLMYLKALFLINCFELPLLLKPGLIIPLPMRS